MGWKLALMMFAVMCGMGFVGYMYYNDTQQRLAQLRENNARLEIAAQTSKDTIDRLQADAAQFEQANNELRSQLVAAEAYSDDLAGKLRRHNLTVLTLQKPGLIETRVNNATAKLFDEMETITGKPVPATAE
jgi:septal ring factor EnvC (AmiA/AmiB activator)